MSSKVSHRVGIGLPDMKRTELYVGFPTCSHSLKFMSTKCQARAAEIKCVVTQMQTQTATGQRP